VWDEFASVGALQDRWLKLETLELVFQTSPAALCAPSPMRREGLRGDSWYWPNMEDAPPCRQCPRKFARALRRDMTKAEALLWSALRDHRLAGHKFRRQTPIGPYVADFVCLSKRIIVEADGRTHESYEAAFKDAARDAWLRREGYRVLRFADDLIIGGLQIVVERIRATLAE
jgi:very-short-patch-repair endonuclease